jgi:glucose-1-phosphate thymidylyltransferase
MAGGSGTRLYPVTHAVSKQLLPVYDKPMVYYPLTTLMLAGVKDILVVSTANDLPIYRELLEDGTQWGISISYAAQYRPGGIAQAFTLGKAFIGDDRVALILGDNLFYGHDLSTVLMRAAQRTSGATIFSYQVDTPERYGVVTLNSDGKATSIEEKPQKPRSKHAVVGLYFYDNRVVSIAEKLEPSARGELEITDINNAYLHMDELHVEQLGRGYAWLDTGTHETLLQASLFIQTIEQRQGLKIGCPEEVAFRMGYISKWQLFKLADILRSSGYGKYLTKILMDG